jgi:hypothetical protein
MCPDKKLEWFDPDQATEVEQLVQQRWLDTYKTSESSSQPDSSPIKVYYPYFFHPHRPENGI